MSWKAHLALSLTSTFAAFAGAAYAAKGHFEHPLAWFLCGVLAALAVRIGVRLALPARCPACAALRFRQGGSRPIVYDCAACGHHLDTPISEGQRRV